MDPARKGYLLSLTQFPQMTVNESAIARAWLIAHADEYDDVDFNRRVGTSLELGTGYDDTTRRQAALLSQKRIDIVASRGNDVTLVEVKLRVSLAALGQLLGYAVLYRVDHPETANMKLVAIGNSALIDAAELLNAHGVTVEIYPDVTLVSLPYG